MTMKNPFQELEERRKAFFENRKKEAQKASEIKDFKQKDKAFKAIVKRTFNYRFA